MEFECLFTKSSSIQKAPKNNNKSDNELIINDTTRKNQSLV